MIAALSLLTLAACGQNYTKNGKEFSSVRKERTSSVSEGKKTDYTWKTSNGKVYDIYISERGACYILVVSSKTGKQYKRYLPKDVANEIKKEINK